MQSFQTDKQQHQSFSFSACQSHFSEVQIRSNTESGEREQTYSWFFVQQTAEKFCNFRMKILWDSVVREVSIYLYTRHIAYDQRLSSRNKYQNHFFLDIIIILTRVSDQSPPPKKKVLRYFKIISGQSGKKNMHQRSRFRGDYLDHFRKQSEFSFPTFFFSNLFCLVVKTN